MRRYTVRSLGPQGGTLAHAEAVLLVYDRKPERPVPDRILYERMRPHHQLHASVRKPFEQRPALFFCGTAGQQGALHASGRKILLNIGKMLLCKHFRRSHDAGLIAVSYGDEAAQHGNHGLTGADVSLQQTVHLRAAGHIGPYLLYHPLLRSGEGVREGVVAGMEGRADVLHHQSVGGLAAHVLLLEQAELQIEEFFELQSACGSRQSAAVRGKMYVVEGPLQ